MVLPGPGSIYHSLQMSFRRPVFINDEVTAVIQVKYIDHEKLQVTFDTYCFNQKNEVVITGSSLAVVPREKLFSNTESKEYR